MKGAGYPHAASPLTSSSGRGWVSPPGARKSRPSWLRGEDREEKGEEAESGGAPGFGRSPATATPFRTWASQEGKQLKLDT